MRRATRLAIVFLVACTVCGSANAESYDDPAARTRLTEFENGLRVLTLVDRTSPIVSFQSWVDVGSGDEGRFTGLAHLFEHMMFRGTENVPGDLRDRLLRERGSRGNAFTSNDFTVYFEDVSAEHLPLVIELEADRLANLIISPEVLDTERQVVLEERRFRTEDNPQGRLVEALLALSFVAHPYRRPTVGWMSDVEQVQVEQCVEFFDEYYVPGNIVVSIAGDFDEEATLGLLRRHLGRLPAAPKPARNPTLEPPQQGERRAQAHASVRGPLLGAAWHAPASGHADAEPLDLLSAILSAGFSSRLNRRLVYEEQEALYAYGGYWELKRAGLFYAAAGVRPGHSIERVEALIYEEIARLANEPPTPAELDRAKRQLEVALVSGLGTNHALASRNAEELLTFGRIRSLDERLQAFAAVTAEDVSRVARTYLTPEGRSVVHVVPAPEETP
ncbi:MAG: insulinase family protein [Myxococcales bacterium]|nr:insulinase family protein [Myxococcales bacterium]